MLAIVGSSVAVGCRVVGGKVDGDVVELGAGAVSLSNFRVSSNGSNTANKTIKNRISRTVIRMHPLFLSFFLPASPDFSPMASCSVSPLSRSWLLPPS